VRRIANLALLIVVSAAVFLVLGEAALRVVFSRHTFYDVEMSRYALELKSDSDNPLIGHHHRPGREAVLMGVTIRTNSDGFRDAEYPLARGTARRIVFLGDSLTLGWGVEKEQTFEQLLESDLNEVSPTEILNLGVGNYNTTQAVNLFVDKGLKYAPDAVVLFWFINDAEPMPRASRLPGLGRSRIVTFFWSRLAALGARMSEEGGFREYYAGLYREGSAGWEMSKQALARLKELSRERGFDFKVVLLPELHELADYPFTAEHRLVMDYLHGIGVEALDLAPRFRAETQPQALWVARDDAHPNARAHALIARYTLDFLRERGGP
jgi:lysophospholipase L1-like esterase